MKQLSKECIELIEQLAIDKALNDIHASVLKAGMRLALTNPKILKQANLYTQEEMDKAKEDVSLNFAEWVDVFATQNESGKWYSSILVIKPETAITTKELFDIYQNKNNPPKQ
jgi:hypothetical protein